MKRRLLSITMVGLLAAGFGLAAVVSAQTATADTQICDQYGRTTTQADGSTATNGAPTSYPTVYNGCHHGNCSSSGNALRRTRMRSAPGPDAFGVRPGSVRHRATVMLCSMLTEK